ncbi:MAG: hypothetical protein EON92_05550 [Burkholderiales bacterium]|nr:MAG: hypothetical protein EON92_05550 [Burkholderiales bacterium]
MNDFVEAQDKLEAVTRLSALTGSPPETLGPGSKERKSLLVNLALGLTISVDTTADKPEVARQIAARLGMAWTPDCWSTGQTITLVGLNRLLSGAHREVSRRRKLAGVPTGQQPARSKLEAVTRISSLTDGPPQTLGPGSKERKSVLLDLEAGLNAGLDTSLSKTDLARALVEHLGGTWDDTCWSAGQTITLEGLNRVLLRAEERLRDGGGSATGVFDTPTKEAQALLAVIAESLPSHMDGRTCVEEMHATESRHWAQDEWAGFYFEHVALPDLVNTFGGGPTSFENTVFDYSLTEVWDLKCHSDSSSEAILNARGAIETCLTARGFGLLVLEGTTQVDDGSFREWQRDFRKANGRSPAPRAHPPAFKRKSKASFLPTRLDAFYFADTAALESALDLGIVSIMSQGKQADGSARKSKYKLHTEKAKGTWIHVAELSLPSA